MICLVLETIAALGEDTRITDLENRNGLAPVVLVLSPSFRLIRLLFFRLASPVWSIVASEISLWVE